MRAAQSRLVVSGVTLSTFVECRMKLKFLLNNFSVAVIVPELDWKQRIRATYGNTQVFARFSSKISTFWLLFSQSVPSFQAD